MSNLILSNLSTLLWVIPGLTLITGVLAVQSFIQPSPTLIPISFERDVEDIVSRFKNEQLTDLDDVTLARAADRLEYVYKHFWDGIIVSQLSLNDVYALHDQQQQLRHIADSIWRLLTKRYGCND